MDMTRRQDLPRALHERERRLRTVINRLERDFPGNGIILMVFDTQAAGDTPKDVHMSYISNAQRKDMIPALREQADRLDLGTADTAGRGEA
jgi:hypothetical protein